jgi:hypothetical protein
MQPQLLPRSLRHWPRRSACWKDSTRESRGPRLDWVAVLHGHGPRAEATRPASGGRWVLLAVVALLIAGIIILVLRPRPRDVAFGATHPVAVEGALELDPAISPDGQSGRVCNRPGRPNEDRPAAAGRWPCTLAKRLLARLPPGPPLVSGWKPDCVPVRWDDLLSFGAGRDASSARSPVCSVQAGSPYPHGLPTAGKSRTSKTRWYSAGPSMAAHRRRLAFDRCSARGLRGRRTASG